MTAPPRFLEVGMHFEAARGGADRYFAGLLQGLEALGHGGTAAAFGPAPAATEGSVRRISLGSEDAGLWARWQALRKLRRQQAGTANILATHFALYAWPLLGVAPQVVHFHGPWAGESAGEGQKALRVALKRMLESRVYAKAKRVIVLSRAFRDLAVKEYGIDSDLVVIIPGGVDTRHFHPMNSAEARRQLQWPEQGALLLSVRRLVPRMGLEALIEAFASTLPRNPTATLVLAGRGPLADSLQTRVRELGLERRVLFPGFISDSDLPIAYAAANCSIVPSQELEGFGLITLESLACGTPVLVTPVGGLPETVAGLDPSLILRGCDQKALAQGLGRALNKSDSLPSAQRCRDYAEAQFSWSRIAARVAAVYADVHREAQAEP